LGEGPGSCHTEVMDEYEVTPDGRSFAVRIRFNSGRREIKHGFKTEAEAEAWAKAEHAKALLAARARKPEKTDGPDTVDGAGAF
jgi:hypothetical protein